MPSIEIYYKNNPENSEKIFLYNNGIESWK
nr:MAG TPA: hypothetical protein [Caudoviricetes sp.]DAZ29386.1 MAG TPA: hypothetical protein [Caudoviricetes sp.]